MFIQHIGATGVQNITDGDESYISCVEFTVYGFTGSMIPQTTQMTDGPVPSTITPVYYNATYVNADTGTSYAAGTAITANGRYLIDTSGAKLALNVTNAGDNDFYVFGKPLAGTAAGAAASGGGGVTNVATATAAAPTYTEGSNVPLSVDDSGNLRVVGAATTVPLLTQGTDQTGTFLMPTMDAVGREGYQIVTGGAVAATASAAGIKPVLTGGSDASGNVQVQPFVLPSAATSVNTTAPFVMSAIGGRNSTSGVNIIGVVSFITDGNANPAALAVGAVEYNGATFDRRRNNADVVGLASGARTATTFTTDQTSYNWKGVIVYINVTALTATGTLTVSIQGKDAISGNYYDMLVGTAIVATGNQQLYYFPGAAITTNVSGPGRLPRTWRVNCVHGNGVSITYSVNLSMLE